MDRPGLREALENLLEDTEHRSHECGDADCPVSRARAALAGDTEPAAELGAAWTEAEGALPEGWQMYSLTDEGRQRGVKTVWRASVINGDSHAKAGLGPTPAAALRALAARLALDEDTGPAAGLDVGALQEQVRAANAVIATTREYLQRENEATRALLAALVRLHAESEVPA